MKTWDVVIVGSNIAALVCFRELCKQRKKVLLLSPSATLGAHFYGVELDGHVIDAGMNFFEFTSYNAEILPDISSYNTARKNDSGRFVKLIERYIQEDLGITTHAVDTPKMWWQNAWLNDFYISDQLNFVDKLSHEQKNKILAELKTNLEDLKIQSLHAKNKNKSDLFITHSLADISRYNHGSSLHELLIEPLCLKIAGQSTQAMLARYHRLLWLPLMYPETILDGLTKSNYLLKPPSFHYPQSGSMRELITALTANSSSQNGKIQTGIEIKKALKENSYAQLVWAMDLTTLLQTFDLPTVDDYDKANISLVLLSVAKKNLQQNWSTVFLPEHRFLPYRVTNHSAVSGANAEHALVSIEFNTDFFSQHCQGKKLNDVAIETLQEVNLLSASPMIHAKKEIHIPQAILLPTKKSLETYQKQEQLVQQKLRSVQRLGNSAGFSTTSLNDQIVQGLKLAEELKEGALMPTTKQKLDAIAKDYHQSEHVPDKFIEDLLQEYSFQIMRECIGRPSGPVLELGYGEGIITQHLVKTGYNLTLLEGSQRLIDSAKERFKTKINYEHALFEEFEPKKQFQVILANHVLEHVDDPVLILKKMKKWLKPKTGRLFIIVPNAESLHRQIGLLMNLQTKLDELSPRDHLVGHQRVYSLKTLQQDLNKAGFKIQKAKGYFLKTVSNGLMLNYDPKLLQALLKISENLPPEMLANLAVLAKLK